MESEAVVKGLSSIGALLVCLSACAQEAPAQASWNKDVPELAVLDRWAGTVASEIEAPFRASGKSTAVWTVDGRFLRQDWTIDSSPEGARGSGTALMTYDTNEKAYRSWIFQPDGVVVESKGKWDEAKRTMTWASQPTSEGMTVETTAQFQDDHSERWKIVVKDKQGKRVAETTGRNSPPKK